MLAAIVAWQQNGGLPTRPFALYLDGVDVIWKPGQIGNAYSVPIESVVLVEAAPGQVSSLEFTIEVPTT
jgi:hypothetical protein